MTQREIEDVPSPPTTRHPVLDRTREAPCLILLDGVPRAGVGGFPGVCLLLFSVFDIMNTFPTKMKIGPRLTYTSFPFFLPLPFFLPIPIPWPGALPLPLFLAPVVVEGSEGDGVREGWRDTSESEAE
jgi:hypothetical protein